MSLLERFEAGTEVDEQVLSDARLVQTQNAVIRILGDGELTKKLTVKAHKFSKSAVEKIEKAGGTVIVLGAASADAKGEAS